MATKVFMEALSPTMEEGKVVSWLKHEGDEVHAGDVLAEVETDKAVMELQARGDGVLRKIVHGEGTTVEVGNLVAVIASPDEDIEAIIAEAGGDGATPATARGAPSAEELETPEPETALAPSGPRPSVGDSGGDGHVRASPLARRMARERGIDLSQVQGSGPGGRIVKRDIESITAVPTALPTPAAPSRDWEAEGYEDVELSQVRKTIAKRLSQSLGPIPHFFLTSELDMTRATEARAELNAIDGAPRISINDIIIKVVAMALRQHRECNAWWQGDHIRYFNDVHVSMAVAIEEGLITPVLRYAHRKSLREIAHETRALVERARARKLTPEEYTGGTFSISNLGMFGIDEFTAVINPPEAGILAVGQVADAPVVVEGQVAVRPRMRVTMSCDHRVIDGATGARFLATVKRMMENPLAMVW